MYRKTIIAIIGLVILFVLADGARSIILGGGKVYTLASGPALTGAISQSLAVNSASPIPVEGKDYSFSAAYFDNQTWAVGVIQPLNNSINPSVVVLEKKDGVFQVVLPPGSAIASSELHILPADVAAYVALHEAVFTPVVGQ